jgi:hypothetical protein
VERLNAQVRSEGTRYFWSGTRLFSDGGSFGAQAPDEEPDPTSDRVVDNHLRQAEVKQIWIDSEGRLCVQLADESLDLSHIYRASASGVEWNEQLRAVCSPVPNEWSYADWFIQIVEDARNEYGIDVVLASATEWSGISTESRAAIELARSQMRPHAPSPVDDRTMARYVGDDHLRSDARDLFLKGQWKAAVAKLEALRYPQFMDAADKQRLEVAKKRSENRPYPTSGAGEEDN